MMRTLSLACGAIVLAAAASAQSNIGNARIESRPGADLAGTFATLSNGPGPLWIGYGVPAQDPDYDGCCYDGGPGGLRRGGCALDDGRSSGTVATAGGAARTPIQLEAATQAVVLFRIENREVRRIRTYAASCDIDAGGATLYWLNGVATEASIDLLLRFADRAAPEGARHENLLDSAMLAIAMHRTPAADRALATLMGADRLEHTRKQAAFWAANARGRTGFEMVRRALLDTTTGESVRKPFVFAIAQSREAEVVDTLTTLARNDASPAVRGEALFWLAQKAGRKAASAITAAIEDDPDTKVKERAVFALSQLPQDEGVPKLIDVARTNRNPAVRKQAMFWLGQSKDARAIDFFVEVLARP